MGRGRALETEAELNSAKKRMEAIATEASRLEAPIKAKRDLWFAVNEQQFEHDDQATCPTCGQGLPEEQLSAAREKALADFNHAKAVSLEQVSEEGKAIKANLEILMAENSDLVVKANKAEQRLQEEVFEVSRIEAEIDALRDQTKPITGNPAYTKKQNEKEQLEKVIAQLQAGSYETAEGVRREIADLNDAITGAESVLMLIKQHEVGLKRIDELKEQEKTLAAEFERLERELYLTEQFIRTKVAMLEDKINSRFKYARFKMFDAQINGGITEVCETLFQGVPYSSGLNNAARINVGLDIINTLAEHYNFNAPIFIDNREAVTRVIETTGQLISLIVSEPDKVLRVENDAKLIKEAV
jgi:hypothetical protein